MKCKQTAQLQGRDAFFFECQHLPMAQLQVPAFYESAQSTYPRFALEEAPRSAGLCRAEGF